MTTTTTTATFPPAVDSRHLAAYGLGQIPDQSGPYAAVLGQDNLNAAYAYSNFRDRDRDRDRDREQHQLQQQQQQHHQHYSSFGESSVRGGSSRMDVAPRMRSSSYNEFSAEKPSGPAYDPAVGSRPATANDTNALQQPAQYDHAPPTASTAAAAAADSNDRLRYTPSPYLRESFRQSKDDSGVFTDVRSATDTPVDVLSESSATPGRQSQHLQNGMPKHPSISPTNGNVPPRHSPIIPSSAAPSYKPTAIPISSSTRAVAQQPTYITPPSSPTPIAVNPVYNTYAPDTRYNQQTYRPAGYPQQDGREICVECAMRDQDMADVDVTGPGVWDRESDIHYHELCRQEAEEEERARTKASNSSSESHQVVVRPADHSRPRARGNRLTEPNLKLWLSMFKNPREPQARQQTIDLYIKTQTALLEAEALARARAMQESRLLESKLKDTYDSLRRSTYDTSTNNNGAAVDENGVRLKASHGQKRSVSGPTPLSLGPIALDGSGHHARHQSQGREVTLLENGMIVEQVDVRKEERERRREEKRERERERSRARKSSRGSGGDRNGERNGEVMSMYSANSPLPYQTDSGFYTASNGSGPILARERDRPMSLSQSSTRAMSVLTAPQPLTPPPGSAPGSVRPPNTRVHSQISLVDSQSISSASMSANRRSKFFAFRNWSEAWKSRDSFAPSGIMSLSGSMMDMHLALDQEKQAMQMRPPTVDLGSNAPSIRHSQIFPRRASVSGDRDVEPRGIERPKKKKGLAKIWGLVKGNRGAKNEVQRGREAPPVERPEDDTPLAPPPPLSYLVNRTSRERSMSNASRRTSVPPSSGTAAPPPTAALPTPTSIRNTWLEDASCSRQMGGMLPAHTEESHSNANGYGTPESDPPKVIQAVSSEPDNMLQRGGQDIPPELQPPVIRAPSSPRPISVYSLHKSLPPLPNEIAASQSMPTPIDSPRPVTMFDMNPQNVMDGNNLNLNNEALGLGSPQPYFRRDMRRQSFGGLSSRPDLPASGGTFPLNGRSNNNMRPVLGGPQDPFGYSPYAEMGSTATAVPASRSVGRLGLGNLQQDYQHLHPAAPRCDNEKAAVVGKRRSKFGLANLLSKVTGGGSGSRSSLAMREREHDARLSLAVPSPYVPPAVHPGPPTSESDPHQDGSPSVTDYGAGNGGSSRSRHNNASNGGGLSVNGGGGGLSVNGFTAPSRMSVASRRAIEELVDQDPKFVAYRYPSVDQNISFLR
ncbi:uncharacterized protein FOMMEDRAFT_28864 [Fomitiporia mediterranea MF3/22]|uniref:uncharacterized protein n=1 Tax=Fomitiporia mediterranea (strain MF3/22) TaxID=694068 RepID=UPI00044084EC|nr:uncharacterized protein FOMMEDRAFT_28864 [Fomitiporia mediterranea MF3/22]EJD03362.1 hypothetical protein FOMMEDRAFT_28864 [Fomitiporia mediterranea MF3/22]